MRSRGTRVILCACALLPGLVAPLAGQGSRFEVVYGAWFADDDTTARVFHAGIHRSLLGPLGWGLGFFHAQDSRDSLSRSLSGGEVSLSLWREGTGPYVLTSVGLGVRHTGGGGDAVWTAGAGYQVRLMSLFSLGIEARYRMEDTRVRGFWQLDAADRRGVQLAGRLSFGIGGSRERGTVASQPGSPDGAYPAAPAAGPPANGPASSAPLPPETDPYAIALASGASEEAARLTASVVETALAAMGSPYQWGGTNANGFDCSGLIQFAYAKHGVLLPRISRDQARMGQATDRNLAGLRPGDILAFSGQGTASQVSHVGLYVGGGQFIHSSSTGVKLSTLDATDGDSRWWRDRWVAARRIVE